MSLDINESENINAQHLFIVGLYVSNPTVECRLCGSLIEIEHTLSADVRNKKMREFSQYHLIHCLKITLGEYNELFGTRRKSLKI